MFTLLLNLLLFFAEATFFSHLIKIYFKKYIQFKNINFCQMISSFYYCYYTKKVAQFFIIWSLDNVFNF